MTRLDRIQERLVLARRIYGSGRVLASWYVDDVAVLLDVATAALTYRDATRIPDGVQRAEQVLFSALNRLEQSNA
jgi:hypothetical protein